MGDGGKTNQVHSPTEVNVVDQKRRCEGINCTVVRLVACQAKKNMDARNHLSPYTVFMVPPMATPQPRVINTRMANKSRHPGAPDMPAPRRSSDVVNHERAACEAAASQARQEQLHKVRRAAAIEDELQKKSAQLHEDFDQPASKITQSLRKAKSKPTAQPDHVTVTAVQAKPGDKGNFSALHSQIRMVTISF